MSDNVDATDRTQPPHRRKQRNKEMQRPDGPKTVATVSDDSPAVRAFAQSGSAPLRDEHPLQHRRKGDVWSFRRFADSAASRASRLTCFDTLRSVMSKHDPI